MKSSTSDVMDALEKLSNELIAELKRQHVKFFHIKSSGKILTFDSSHNRVKISSKMIAENNEMLFFENSEIKEKKLIRISAGVFGVGLFTELRHKNNVILKEYRPGKSFAKLVDCTDNSGTAMECAMLPDMEEAGIWEDIWSGRGCWPEKWKDDYESAKIDFLKLSELSVENEKHMEVFERADVAYLLLKHKFHMEVGLTKIQEDLQLSSVRYSLHNMITSHTQRCDLMDLNLCNIIKGKVSLAL